MDRADAKRRRGLTRQAIVARALEIGDAEGLDAVSLRRLAAEFGVTSMALYRHVRDKQDLVNAMTEAILEGLDLSAGLRPSMSWTERMRRAMLNYKEQIDARPLALPLSIAYSGDGPVAFWRMLELLLSILLGAGFARSDAVVLIRVMSNLLTGYLVLLHPNDLSDEVRRDPRQRDLVRRRIELAQLSLPPEEFPNLVESAAEIADVWISDPDRWWRNTVDLIIFGLERMLERSRHGS